MDVRPLHLADLTLPQGHPLAGRGCAVYAFVIMHRTGPVLVDTGIGEHPGIERLYRPACRPLEEALAGVGVQASEVRAVINTHLHFDHCGGNRWFAGRPLFVQAAEYEAAHEPLYTVVEWVDFPGAVYERVNGEAEVFPGVTVVPTPGHTPGHQSVVIETTAGRAVIAGQAAYSAREFDGDARAAEEGAAGAWNSTQYAVSLQRIRELAPRYVYFSHDGTAWRAHGAVEEGE